jgi:hypothetical protein
MVPATSNHQQPGRHFSGAKKVTFYPGGGATAHIKADGDNASQICYDDNDVKIWQKRQF